MKSAGKSSGLDQPVGYEITLRGRLGEGWSDWFQGLAVTYDGETTTLTCVIADQAALRGILCRAWDLSLTVVSVRQMLHPSGRRAK